MKKLFLLSLLLCNISTYATEVIPIGKFKNGLSDSCVVCLIVSPNDSWSIKIQTGDILANRMTLQNDVIDNVAILFQKPKEIKKFRKDLLYMQEKYEEWTSIYQQTGDSSIFRKDILTKMKMRICWRIHKKSWITEEWYFPCKFSTHGRTNFGDHDLVSTSIDCSQKISYYDKYFCYIELRFYSSSDIQQLYNILSEENINSYLQPALQRNAARRASDAKRESLYQ